MERMNKIFEFMLWGIVLIIIVALLSSCNSNPTKNISEPQDFVVPDWTTDYISIVEEYRKFVDYIINEDFESAIDNNIFSTPDSSLSYNWSCMIGETNIWYYRDFPKAEGAFGYALEDLNGNGNNELILLLRDYTVLAIFSMTNENPKLIDAFWPRHKCAIYDTGLLYTLSSSGADSWYYKIQQISQDGSNLLDLEEYGSKVDGEHQNYYKVIDGKTHDISKAEFDEFQEKFPSLLDTTASEITKNSGIKFIPLFDE